VYKHTGYREGKKTPIRSGGEKIYLSIEKKTVPEEVSSPPQGR
jgi:hypothetical protein